MGEPENRRQREAMRAALAPYVAEEVLLGEWFLPAKGMEDDGAAAFRRLRRMGSSGEHAADRIRGRNVLVLTPTRLLAFTARAVRATPPVAPKKQIGDWALGDVALEFKGRKATSYFAHAGGSYSSKIVRATLTIAGDDRPLVIDFPDTPLARELLKAAKAATEAARGAT